MNDKRFVKIKQVSEERYFRDDRELIRFIEKMEGMTIEEMGDMCQRLNQSKAGSNIGTNYIEMRLNLKRDFVIMGNFLVRIFRGTFQRTSGTYHINILAEQRADLLCMRDRKQLFNIV